RRRAGPPHPGGACMILSSGKHNRRRPVRKKKASGRTLLRALPRPRFPRGRAAVLTVVLLIAGCLALWQGALAYGRGALLTVSRVEVTGNRHWGTERLLEHAGLDIGLRVHEIPFRAARKSLLQLPGIE